MSRARVRARARAHVRPSVLPSCSPSPTCSARDTRVTARRERHAPPCTFNPSVAPPYFFPPSFLPSYHFRRPALSVRWASLLRDSHPLRANEEPRGRPDCLVSGDADPRRRTRDPNASTTQLTVDSVRA